MGKKIILKRKKNLPKKRAMRRPLTAPNVDTISHCALKFAVAATRPFDILAQGACLPVPPSIPSHKITTNIRVIVTVGTDGYGFAAFSPCTTYQGPSMYYSNESYNLPKMKIFDADAQLKGGVDQASFANNPYTDFQLIDSVVEGSSQARCRIVAGGARCSYIGTTLNQSGNVMTYADPGHANVTRSGHSIIGHANVAVSTLKPVTRNGFCGEMSFFPISSVEAAYPGANYGTAYDRSIIRYPYSSGEPGFWDYENGVFRNGFFNSEADLVGHPIGVFGFSGVPGNQFLVEYVLHLEYVGPAARSLTTPTHVDYDGFCKVQAALEEAPRTMVSSPSMTLWDAFKCNISKVTQELKPIALTAIAKMGTAALAAMV